MSKTAFERDNILTAEERTASARKCLQILVEASETDLSLKDYNFLESQRREARRGLSYAPTERQLAWLRDVLSKYID